MFSRIGLGHLRYAIAAAESGSFRRAAQRLGVEQSAVSRRIRELEDEIGGELFRRQASGVTLTELGERFLGEARHGVSKITCALKAAADSAREVTQLRIGVFGPLTMAFLSELFLYFRKIHPETALHFSEGSCPQLIVSVRRGEIDIAFVAEPPSANDCEFVHLWNEPIYLAMSDSDPLIERTAVRWGDLRDRHFIVTDLPTGTFAKGYLERHVGTLAGACRIEQMSVTRESLMQIVAHGYGVTIAGSAHVRHGLPGIAFRLIEDAVLRYGAVHPRGALHRNLERLLALAKSFSERDDDWFARQRLMRPEPRRLPHADRHHDARGRTPDRLQ